MVANVSLRFDVETKLPDRRASLEANRFILDHLEQLQRELTVRRGVQTLSSQDGRIVK